MQLWIDAIEREIGMWVAVVFNLTRHIRSLKPACYSSIPPSLPSSSSWNKLRLFVWSIQNGDLILSDNRGESVSFTDSLHCYICEDCPVSSVQFKFLKLCLTQGNVSCLRSVVNFASFFHVALVFCSSWNKLRLFNQYKMAILFLLITAASLISFTDALHCYVCEDCPDSSVQFKFLKLCPPQANVSCFRSVVNFATYTSEYIHKWSYVDCSSHP